MEFEWDESKAVENEDKHGISFRQAVEIWSAPHLEVDHIAYSEDGEKRNATMGWIENKLFVAIWTKRNQKIRLISVRRARKNEEKVFLEKIQDPD